jgi:hypothetical protein
MRTKPFKQLYSRSNVHAGGASGDSSALLQALELSPAGVLGLALHVIIVVIAASGTDEEGGREQRRRTGTDLLDGGDITGERGGVDEQLLVEPGRGLAIYFPTVVRFHGANWRLRWI